VRVRTMASAAVVGLGIATFPAPAHAATAPTVTLENQVVTITGTAERDLIRITTNAAGLLVDFGIDGTTDAQIPRSAFREVRVLAAGGNDGLSGHGAGEVPVTLDGGAGDDSLGVLGTAIGASAADDAPTTLNGGDGNDIFFTGTFGPLTILAGAGDDRVSGGGQGVGQTVSLGDGNDRLTAEFADFGGDRRDIVDGGAGQDVLNMEGTFATEAVGLSAAKGRLVVFHDFRNEVISAGGVEDVTFIGFGGLDFGSGDAVGVDDLSSTDVQRFTANFSADRSSEAPNGAADTLTVRGTPGVDNITVSGAKADVRVAGLRPVVAAVFLQPEDFLLIDTLAGNDVVDSSGLQPGLVQLLVR
jgi:hypothetical protein